MKQIVTAFGISSNSRDSAIQVFDRFLATAYFNDEIAQHDADFMSYVAAVALNLGYKLQESSRQLHLVRNGTCHHLNMVFIALPDSDSITKPI